MTAAGHVTEGCAGDRPARHNGDVSASDENARVEPALAMLRARGERVTPARCAVLTELARAGREEHLSADELAVRVEASTTGVHRATVYRVLTRLAELGLVSHTHLGGGATVYHLVAGQAETGGVPVHAHLQCSTCGTVIDVEVEELQPLADRLRDQLGFRLAPEHTALLGLCATCADAD